MIPPLKPLRWLPRSLTVAGIIWLLVNTSGGAATRLGEDLFTNSTVRRIRIELAAAAVESLRQNPREFVSATVAEATNTYPEVAVHLKGRVGSFRPVDDKPSLTLDFSRFREGQKFHGLRRIHLNNSVEDPGYVNEKIGSELFAAAGVPAPRVARVRVVLNGRDLGVYVLKEGFTEDFLAGHFKQVGGDLFEPEDGQDVDQRLKRNSVKAPTQNGTALSALAAAVLEPDPAQRWQRLCQVLDMDRFLTFMALEVMLGHRDGYCIARNNFRVYHDLDTGKVVFFPSGMDQLLGTADLPWQPSMSGLVAKAVMETPEGKPQYRTRFCALLTNVFQVQLLTNRVDQLALGLRPFLRGSEWLGVRDETALVKERIEQRHRSLQAQLSRPPLQRLELVNDTGNLADWQPFGVPMDGEMDSIKAADGVPALHIISHSATVASWRTTAILNPGRYRFAGRAKVAGVRPLPQGRHQGAGLRVAGRTQPGDALIGDSAWREIQTDFEVEKAEEEIEFICELQASAGEVWFDSSSLRVISLP